MVARTKTGKVARKVIEKSGKGTFVFNDKLKDGRRSLKVCGWTEAEYRKAKRKLKKKGCVVDLVRVKQEGVPGRMRFRSAFRLHVQE
jgi:hypothetical protein